MRQIEFVGLNNAGADFVELMNQRHDLSRSTLSLTGYELRMRVWESSNGQLYKEVVQLELLSTNAMVFTCIAMMNGELVFTWFSDTEHEVHYDVERALVSI